MDTYPSDSLLGSVVDRRYRVDERVGAGAFGCVYAAWHLSLDVRVALKVLTLDADLGERERSELIARFLNEGRVLTRLKHPGIVAAIDLGTVSIDGDAAAVPYLVMEWCEGRTLKQLLAAEGPRSPEQAYEIIEPLADALAHAHATGVLHRDIKPSNVMVSTLHGRPSPRLIDFGIAKHSAPRDAGTNTESVTVGAPPYTAAYAAPEQVAGARTSAATDVHGLGLLFIELLTGRSPYGNVADGTSSRAGELRDPALAIIDATRPSAGAHAGAFGAVIAKAVALRAADRYPDARSLRDALRGAARQQLGEDHPIPSVRLAAKRGRSRALFAGLGLLAVGLLALTALAMRPATHAHVEPSAEAASSAIIAPPPLCSLDEATQRTRLQATGLDVLGFEAGWARLGANGNRVMTVEWDDTAAAKARLSAVAETIAEIDYLAIAYAVDEACQLHIRGPRGDVVSSLDKLLAGRAASLRGDTAGGPDPLAMVRPSAAEQRSPPARRLRDLSAQDLVARVVASPFFVHDYTGNEKPNGKWAQVSFKTGETYARFDYFMGPYARNSLLEKLGQIDGVVYYAIEEPVAILARGLPDPRALDVVLRGLGASIKKSPP